MFKLTFGLALFTVVMVACNLPSFTPDVEDLEIEEAPPASDFGQPDIDNEPEELEAPPEEEPIEMDPIEVEIELVVFCTTNVVYLRPEPHKPTDFEEAAQAPRLPIGTQVTATGKQAQGLADGDEYTWHEVDAPGQERGWIAEDSDWLVRGECSEVIVVDLAEMRIIQSPSRVPGNPWDPDSTHYGVDVHSSTGDLNLYSPLDGTVVASDSCEACLEVDEETGQNQDDRTRDYNYGYGAVVITEYPYADMTEDQIEGLEAAGITVEEGQSVYMLTAHLNPNRDIADPGTVLTAGDSVATIGTSGDSSGVHGHIEMAVTDSGLRPRTDQQINGYWVGSIVDDYFQLQGNRVDPTGLFD